MTTPTDHTTSPTLDAALQEVQDYGERIRARARAAEKFISLTYYIPEEDRFLSWFELEQSEQQAFSGIEEYNAMLAFVANPTLGDGIIAEMLILAQALTKEKAPRDHLGYAAALSNIATICVGLSQAILNHETGVQTPHNALTH